CDPSVAKVIRRRLGPEVLDSLVDPLLGGINASDIEQLSFAAAAPQLAEAVGAKRSLIRALRQSTPSVGNNGAALFLGLARGIGELADALTRDALTAGARIETKA